jgi:hypothetical protein
MLCSVPLAPTRDGATHPHSLHRRGYQQADIARNDYTL